MSCHTKLLKSWKIKRQVFVFGFALTILWLLPRHCVFTSLFRSISLCFCMQYSEFIHGSWSRRRMSNFQWSQLRRRMLSTRFGRWTVLIVVLQSGEATGFPIVHLCCTPCDVHIAAGRRIPVRLNTLKQEVVKGRLPRSDAATVRCARARARISLTAPRTYQNPSRCCHEQFSQHQLLTSVPGDRQQEMDETLAGMYRSSLDKPPGTRSTGGTHSSRHPKRDHFTNSGDKLYRICRIIDFNASDCPCERDKDKALFRDRSLHCWPQPLLSRRTRPSLVARSSGSMSTFRRRS